MSEHGAKGHRAAGQGAKAFQILYQVRAQARQHGKQAKGHGGYVLGEVEGARDQKGQQALLGGFPLIILKRRFTQWVHCVILELWQAIQILFGWILKGMKDCIK